MTWEAPPAFQFYGKDWIMSTRRMSPMARLVHLELLMYSWDEDGIDADLKGYDKAIAISPAQFDRAWLEIEDRWPLAEEGKRRNPRQEKQRQEVVVLRDKRSAAGRASGEARNK